MNYHCTCSAILPNKSCNKFTAEIIITLHLITRVGITVSNSSKILYPNSKRNTARRIMHLILISKTLRICYNSSIHRSNFEVFILTVIYNSKFSKAVKFRFGRFFYVGASSNKSVSFCLSSRQRSSEI